MLFRSSFDIIFAKSGFCSREPSYIVGCVFIVSVAVWILSIAFAKVDKIECPCAYTTLATDSVVISRSVICQQSARAISFVWWQE